LLMMLLVLLLLLLVVVVDAGGVDVLDFAASLGVAAGDDTLPCVRVWSAPRKEQPKSTIHRRQSSIQERTSL
jgi:hypothetical protein